MNFSFNVSCILVPTILANEVSVDVVVLLDERVVVVVVIFLGAPCGWRRQCG